MAYPKSPAIALWNPLWTVIWSYIFTPVFGAFLQRTNWSEMGEQDRTANSHMWMILGLVFMFGYLLLEPWLPESNYEDFYFLGSYTLFYAAWVIFDGWAQVPFVRDRYGDNYHHRLWGKPIMLGAGGLVLWMMMSLTYVIAIITLFPDILPPQLPPKP